MRSSPDVIMPGMSGPELKERIKAICPDLPVLFVSRYPREELRRQGLSESGTGFLQKPMTPDELATALRQLLDGRTAGVMT